MDIHVLECPEHDLTISGKCLCVCGKNFLGSVAQELMNRISWSFMFRSAQQKIIKNDGTIFVHISL